MFTVQEYIAYCLGALVVGFCIGMTWQTFINLIRWISNPQ